MRKLMIVITVIGALASIALCGGYGWDQAAELKDRITQAFIYGFVSLATLTLHVAAIRIWGRGWRKSGAFVGAIAMLAFMMTAFTSLGGLATRADKVVAERQDAIDIKADTSKQIIDLETEKAGLKFTRATQATVDAAQRAVIAAEQARDQECAKLGENCRKRQDAVGTALTTLGTAQTNKATTDRFDQIVADLKALRGTGKTSGAGSADPMNALLGKVMGTWAEVLTSWQKVIFAVVYDLCLVALMISIEALGHEPKPARRPEDEKPEFVLPVAEAVIEPDPVSAKLPPRPIPKLVTVRREPPAGPVAQIMTAALEPAKGQRVELGTAYLRYAAACRADGREPVEPNLFMEAMANFCREVSIKTRIEGKKIFLIGVRLTSETKALVIAHTAGEKPLISRPSEN